MYYSRFLTSLCDMVIIGDENGIQRLHLVTTDVDRPFILKSDWQESPSFFSDEIRQIQEYLDGKRSKFDFKLNPQGTAFQKKVWQALKNIPYGTTASYKEIAIAIGNEKASRAVGTANGANPLPIIVPCHRVIGSNNKLTGYAFGLPLKKALIAIEKE